MIPITLFFFYKTIKWNLILFAFHSDYFPITSFVHLVKINNSTVNFHQPIPATRTRKLHVTVDFFLWFWARDLRPLRYESDAELKFNAKLNSNMHSHCFELVVVITCTGRKARDNNTTRVELRNIYRHVRYNITVPIYTDGIVCISVMWKSISSFYMYVILYGDVYIERC